VADRQVSMLSPLALQILFSSSWYQLGPLRVVAAFFETQGLSHVVTVLRFFFTTMALMG